MHDNKDLLDKLKAEFDEAVYSSKDDKFIYVKKEIIAEVLCFLRNSCDYIMFAGITAVDYIDYYDMVYILQKEDASLLTIKVRLEKSEASLPTATTAWKAANVQEREIYDLMGINFEGHDNLKRILCKDDFEGHPLRKDFKLKVVDRF